MNKERNITHSIRVKIILLAFLLASSLMIFHNTAHAVEKPGNVSFLQVKTYKARKGLSKKKYNKNYRMVVLYWTKANNANKYQILYSNKKNGTYKKAVKNPVAGSPSGSWLSCKLAYKNNKNVYFKVVPYNGSTAGNTSTWVSVKAGNTKKNAKSVKISGSNATIYAGDSKSYSAVVKPKKPVVKGVRWISSNSSIAKVDSKGRVTGVSKGTATIYAMAHNGIKKSVKVTIKAPTAPKLVSVNMSSVDTNDKTAQVQFVFNSIQGRKYRIYRRDNSSSYKKIAEVVASSKSTSYVDKGLKTDGIYYTYTAKQVIGTGSNAVLGDYDSEGIMTLDKPAFKEVCWNLTNSELKWETVSGVSKYELYYRIKQNGSKTKIAEFDGSVTSYKESAYNIGTLQSNKLYLYSKTNRKYLDPTVNPIVYILKAKQVDGGKTSSREIEEYHLEPPTLAKAVVSNGKVELMWGKSTMAEGYYIYNENSADAQPKNLIGEVKQPSDNNTVITKTYTYNADKPYYFVRSYAYKNGSKIESTYDTGFHIEIKASSNNYHDKKVLIIGDSIAYGTPYTGADAYTKPYIATDNYNDNKYLFSYPRRIEQITGASITNVSVPGATYTYIDSKKYTSDYSNIDRRCLTITPDQMKKDSSSDNGYSNYYGNYEALEALRIGTSAVLKNTIDTNWNGRSPGRLSDYDVIILAAGTNDAKRCSSLGIGIGDLSLSNTDNTNYAGAVNRILSYIEDANELRIADNKREIQVVFVDLLKRKDISNGDKVISDYQKATNTIVNNWKDKWGQSSTSPKIHQFHHNYLTADNIKTLTSDYLHLTRFAQGQFGAKMADYMIKEGILE